MKLKYLGRYYVDVEHTQGQPYESSMDVLRHDIDHSEIYEMDDIMRADEDSMFDGYYSISNCTSVVFKLVDINEGLYKAWRAW